MEPYQVWQIVTGVAVLVFLIGWLLSQMTSEEQVGAWVGYVRRSSLVLFVLLTTVFFLIPPSQKLKPGLDLAGGTVLTYEVDTSDSSDAKETIAQVIAVLKRRVDPDGLKNLVWRPVGTSRIEIQMPAPPKGTKELRAAFENAKANALEQNLDMQTVDATLRLASDERAAALDKLAAPGSARREALEALAAATDELVAARSIYDAAKERYNEAVQAESQLPDDAPAADQEAAGVAVSEAEEAYIAATEPFLAAQQAEERARKRVESSNLDEVTIDTVLDLPNDTGRVPEGEKTPRAMAIDRLVADHPDLEAAIREVAQSYAAYEKYKGALDDPNDLKALLRGSGVLEFRIAAQTDVVPNLNEYVERLETRGPLVGINEPYRWFKLDDPEKGFAEDAEDREAMRANPAEYFLGRGLLVREYAGEYYALVSNQRGEKMVMGQDDWSLDSAYQTSDDMGFPAIGFTLDPRGGQLMYAMTSSRVGRPMSIILDGNLISAPNIRSALSTNVSISSPSGFSPDEMSYMLQTLNAGSLQATLSSEPVAERTMGAQFGEDNLRAGLRASVLALVLVALFMAFYYLFAGLVANFALMANMVAILGVMAMFEATFTLPGIAGMVLTIGMAVDANVLIYERIREEIERKADIRTAVRLGYERALSTILDANITTLITCVVLGYFTTPEIVGFAKTLGIGIVATMFTALVCTRLIFDLYLDITHAKTLHMLPTVIPAIGRLLHPKVSWDRMRPVFFGLSTVMVIASLALVSIRGQDFLDIEFRSGTQVSFDLGQTEDGQQSHALAIGEARERLTAVGRELNRPAIASANIVALGEPIDGKATGFSIKTLEQDTAIVTSAIKQAFEDVLDTTRVIEFKGMGAAANADAPPVGQAPAYVVRQPRLGDVINRPDVDTDASSFLGGVAILVSDMSEPLSIEQFETRIGRMRSQQQYESIPGTREYQFVPLEIAPGRDDSGATRYRSMVVLVRDSATSYIERPEEFTIRGGFADTQWNLVRDALLRDSSLGSISNFSSQVSKTMTQQAIVAMGLSLLAVVAYIWVRFGSIRYGFAAIVALVHDVTIALGLLALAGLAYEQAGGLSFLLLSDFKIDLVLIAALLTIVGYSLNDTIVVFDRIRENRGRLAVATPEIINDSINQTISRTVLTSGTTLVAIFTLYWAGGPGVHGFAFAMMIGIAVGTYSSIAIASQVLSIGAGRGRKGAGASRGEVATTRSQAVGRTSTTEAARTS